MIIQTIKTLAEGKELTKEEKRYNQSVIEAHPTTAKGQYNINLADLVRPKADKVGTFIASARGTESNEQVQDSFLNQCYVIDNLNFNTYVPFLSADGVEWKEEGRAADNNTLTSKRLQPHRLTTNITISREYLNATGEHTEDEFKQILINAIFSKIVESALSDYEGDDDQPKGIFYGVEATTINTREDLLNLMEQGDSKKKACTWVLSPTAKAKVLNLSDSPLLANGELFNTQAICENRMQSPYIAYMPLDLLAVALFGSVCLTIDRITQSHKGQIVITIDVFADYDFISKEYLFVGKFNEE